jgi:hypothetical protein
LKVAREGVDNTLVLAVERPLHSDAIEILDLFASNDLFSSFTVAHAREILTISKRRRYEPGEYVVRRGEKGNAFYMIAAGVAQVWNAQAPCTRTRSNARAHWNGAAFAFDHLIADTHHVRTPLCALTLRFR